MSKKVKVIGCGNILAYDEGVGVHVVRSLRKESLPPNVDCFELRTPGQFLLELISGADRLVIVDGMSGSGVPGDVKLFRAFGSKELQDALSLTLHGFNLIPLFNLRERVAPETLPGEVLTCAVVVKERGRFGVGLSNDVERRLGEVVSLLLRELNRT